MRAFILPLIIIIAVIRLTAVSSAQDISDPMAADYDAAVRDRTAYCDYVSPASGGRFEPPTDLKRDQTIVFCLKPSDAFPNHAWLYIGSLHTHPGLMLFAAHGEIEGQPIDQTITVAEIATDESAILLDVSMLSAAAEPRVMVYHFRRKQQVFLSLPPGEDDDEADAQASD